LLGRPGAPVSLTLTTVRVMIQPMRTHAPEGYVAEETRTHLAGQPQLLQLRSDRRLGHEWDDWDGNPLEDEGVFSAGPGLFFGLASAAGLIGATLVLGAWWLVAPRLGLAAAWLPGALLAVIGVMVGSYAFWLGSIARVLRTARNPFPAWFLEEGLLPRLLARLERLGVALGYSRDRVGNSLVRVYNSLAAARARPGVSPDDLLVLLPRCLSKEAMQGAMEISGRYGVPLFVASRGRYARQMIAMRRPRRVVAVACERDLVSGIADVAGKLPVLGTTLALPDGPCKNTELDLATMETQIRRFLGLEALPPS
jgi:uncharacterized protein